MLPQLEKFFKGQRARRAVAETMLRYGLKVNGEGKIYCGEIELAPAKFARAIDVDRRVVIQTAKEIAQDEELFEIFHAIEPRALFANAAKKLGFDVIEIRADAKKPGIVAEVTRVLAKNNIAIRQIIADDPDLFPDPVLTIIINGKLKGKVIEQLKGLKVAKELLLK